MSEVMKLAPGVDTTLFRNSFVVVILAVGTLTGPV